MQTLHVRFNSRVQPIARRRCHRWMTLNEWLFAWSVQSRDLSLCSRLEEDHTKSKYSEPADPAALIAEALKRKFAHRYRNDSECESNFSLPARESEPRSEETPAVRSCWPASVILSHTFTFIAAWHIINRTECNPNIKLFQPKWPKTRRFSRKRCSIMMMIFYFF